MKAKDDKCCICDEQAVAYYPCIDPDIPSYPYCADHLEQAMIDTANFVWSDDKDMLVIATYQAKEACKKYRKNKVMKANVPEKIYVYIPDDDIVGTASIQKGFPHQFVTEEYTRTDAFIEKACDYLRNHIDKDAVVAEIERRIKEYQSTGDDYWFPVIENLKNILSFLNTLEVKEVEEEHYNMIDAGSYTTTTK